MRNCEEFWIVGIFDIFVVGEAPDVFGFCFFFGVVFGFLVVVVVVVVVLKCQHIDHCEENRLIAMPKS